MSKRKGIDLCDFDRMSKEAVMAFWGNREKARQKQIEAAITDQGERAGVTSGKNMDGFVALIKDLTEANGLPHADIHLKRALLTLPGYFRSTKLKPTCEQPVHPMTLLTSTNEPNVATTPSDYQSNGIRPIRASGMIET